MTRKRNFNQEEITFEQMFEGLSRNFKETYEEVFADLREESSYKRLRRVGEQQFFHTTESSIPIEEESQRIKLRFAEINLMAISIDDIISLIVAKKFHNESFLSSLKEEVLKIVLKLHSEQNGCTEDESENVKLLQTENPENLNRKKDDEKVVLEKVTDLSKYFAQNLYDISKKVIGLPFEETVEEENVKTLLSNVKKEKIENLSNPELMNLSFDSVSSVHTSDLSSYNDEIVFSSDEETGSKQRKMTLDKAKEELEQIRAKRNYEGGGKKQGKKMKFSDLKPGPSSNDFSSISQKSLPQRIRKPNVKYAEYDILPDVRKKSTPKDTPNKSSASSQMSEMVSRKRGRPRKNLL